MSIVEYKDPLLWRHRFYFIKILIFWVVIDDGHAKSVTFDDGYLILGFLFVLWIGD